MNIGERIKAVREERGLTQAELATKAGLAQATVCRIERSSGERVSNKPREVGADTLKRLAQVLEVSLDYLTGATKTRTLEATVTMDTAARRLVETYSAAKREGKEILATIADYLESQQLQWLSFRPPAVLPRGSRQADAELEKDETLYRVKSVDRNVNLKSGICYVEYICQVNAFRFRAGTAVDIKRIDSEAFLFLDLKDKNNIIKSAVGQGSYSLPDCPNINETLILHNAIERAKEDASMKLRE